MFGYSPAVNSDRRRRAWARVREVLIWDGGKCMHPAMFIYGKTAANGIAVMSYLAERPDGRSGSGEIARARGISKALTAKLLTQLAAAGMVRGTPGPGGGYTLNRAAKDICLLQIVALFEQTSPPSVCPFGHNWCGSGEPCPLHDVLMDLLERNRRFLEDTRLSVFEPQRRDDRIADRQPGQAGSSRKQSPANRTRCGAGA